MGMSVFQVDKTNTSCTANTCAWHDNTAGACLCGGIDIVGFDGAEVVASIPGSEFLNSEAQLRGGGEALRDLTSMGMSHNIFTHSIAASEDGVGVSLQMRTYFEQTYHLCLDLLCYLLCGMLRYNPVVYVGNAHVDCVMLLVAMRSA